MRHAAEFEAKGIPAVVLCAPGFEKRARMQAEGDRIPDLHIIPLSREILSNAYADSTDAGPFIAKAVEAIADEVVHAVTVSTKEAQWASPR